MPLHKPPSLLLSPSFEAVPSFGLPSAIISINPLSVRVETDNAISNALSIPIGIGKTYAQKRRNLQRFHRFGLIVVHMVISKQMKSPVNNQMRGMISDGNALFRRFGDANALRQYDIALQYFAIVGIGGGLKQIILHHRKGQDVGGLVLVAIGAVEAMDLLIGRQLDCHLIQRLVGREGRIGAVRDGGGHGALGQKFPVDTGPAFFMEDGDFNHDISFRGIQASGPS